MGLGEGEGEGLGLGSGEGLGLGSGEGWGLGQGEGHLRDGHRVEDLGVDLVVVQVDDVHLLADALHRALSAQRGDVRAHVAVGLLGELLEVDVVAELHVLRLDAQHLVRVRMRVRERVRDRERDRVRVRVRVLRLDAQHLQPAVLVGHADVHLVRVRVRDRVRVRVRMRDGVRVG